jgi:hypothetical protein
MRPYEDGNYEINQQHPSPAKENGRWYWVRRWGETEWFPAIWEDNWGNNDTWEDFHNEIREWVLIPLPHELLGGGR